MDFALVRHLISPPGLGIEMHEGCREASRYLNMALLKNPKKLGLGPDHRPGGKFL